MVRRGIWLKTLSLFIGETIVVLSAILLNFYLQYPKYLQTYLFFERGLLKIIGITLIGQFVFYLFDLYDVTTARSKRELLMDLIRAVGTTVFILSVIVFLRPTLLLGYLNTIEGQGVARYTNGALVMAMFLALCLMLLWRLLFHGLVRHPRLNERLLIVGTDALAQGIAREALTRRDLSYKVVGFIAEDPTLVGKSLVNPSVLGVTAELSDIVERERIDRVIIALQDRRGHLPVEQLLNLRLQGKAIIEEGAAMFEKLTGRVSVDMLRPSWLIFSGSVKRGRLFIALRRLLNITFALLGLVVMLPIGIITAFAIKLNSRGPIFYLQERVGKNGETFTIIKFRSMYTDAEKDGPQWSVAGDHRITRVGKFIRATRIDELPQFINVLRGEMNFVGPRAERAHFVEQLCEVIPYYNQRHLVEPGLTGWAQVNYGYGSTVEDAIQKFQYDLYYIKNASLIFDLWIILKSVKVVLLGRGQ